MKNKFYEQPGYNEMILDGCKEMLNIVEIRNRFYVKWMVDILQTDIMTKLIITSKLHKLFSRFCPNLHRNGDDIVLFLLDNLDKRIVELKTRRQKRNIHKKSKNGSYWAASSFTFHVEGDIQHQSYLFTIHDMNNLDYIVRVIFISDLKNASIIHNILQKEKIKYYNTHKVVRKRDTIDIKENDILNHIRLKHFIIDNIEVYTDYDFQS